MNEEIADESTLAHQDRSTLTDVTQPTITRNPTDISLLAHTNEVLELNYMQRSMAQPRGNVFMESRHGALLSHGNRIESLGEAGLRESQPPLRMRESLELNISPLSNNMRSMEHPGRSIEMSNIEDNNIDSIISSQMHTSISPMAMLESPLSMIESPNIGESVRHSQREAPVPHRIHNSELGRSASSNLEPPRSSSALGYSNNRSEQQLRLGRGQGRDPRDPRDPRESRESPYSSHRSHEISHRRGRRHLEGGVHRRRSRSRIHDSAIMGERGSVDGDRARIQQPIPIEDRDCIDKMTEFNSRVMEGIARFALSIPRRTWVIIYKIVLIVGICVSMGVMALLLDRPSLFWAGFTVFLLHALTIFLQNRVILMVSKYKALILGLSNPQGGNPGGTGPNTGIGGGGGGGGGAAATTTATTATTANRNNTRNNTRNSTRNNTRNSTRNTEPRSRREIYEEKFHTYEAIMSLMNCLYMGTIISVYITSIIILIYTLNMKYYNPELLIFIILFGLFLTMESIFLFILDGIYFLLSIVVFAITVFFFLLGMMIVGIFCCCCCVDEEEKKVKKRVIDLGGFKTKYKKVIKKGDLGDIGSSCVICLGEFVGKDDVVLMPCNKQHIFHLQCITQWLLKNDTCPICRHDVSPDVSFVK